MRTRVAVLALVVCSLAPLAGEAQTIIRDRSHHSRPLDLSILGLVPYPAGFGAGLRIGIPIVPNGFIGSINDGVFLEPGFEFVYWTDFDHDATGIQVPVLLRWDFFLTRAWTVYGEVGVVFGFFDDPADFRVRGKEFFRPGARPHYFRGVIGGGAMLNFSSSVSLRLDASTHQLGIGVTFRF